MSRRLPIAGFTLIEVLVALVILLVSVLGIVGLSVKTVQQETESYQRVQALNLLQEMVDKINTNRQVAPCYSNGSTGVTVGTDYTGTPACTSGVVTAVKPAATPTSEQLALAVADLIEWNNHLQGTAEQTSASTNVGAVIGARGCVKLISSTGGILLFRVTVAWQGLGPTAAPVGTENTCGEGSYGSEALRRTVNAVVRIGYLS